MLRKRTQGKFKVRNNKKAYYKRVFDSMTKEERMSLKGDSVSKISESIKEINKNIILRLILNNECFELPRSMGSLYVGRAKYRYDPTSNMYSQTVNWKRTLDFWRQYPEKEQENALIYHTNPQTDGGIYKIYWDKSSIRHVGARFYRFAATRTHNRFLASILKDPLRKIDYIILNEEEVKVRAFKARHSYFDRKDKK